MLAKPMTSPLAISRKAPDNGTGSKTQVTAARASYRYKNRTTSHSDPEIPIKNKPDTTLIKQLQKLSTRAVNGCSRLRHLLNCLFTLEEHINLKLGEMLRFQFRRRFPPGIQRYTRSPTE